MAISFQELFRNADEYAGIRASNSIDQCDTSMLFNRDSRNSKILLCYPEINLLKRTVMKIRNDNFHGEIKKKVAIQQIRNSRDDCFLPANCCIPEFSWEDEVEQSMLPDPEESAEDNLKSPIKTKKFQAKQTAANPTQPKLDNISLLVPMQSLRFEVAPYFCFDLDLIVENQELNNKHDQLERIIPNQYSEDYEFVFEDLTENTAVSVSAPSSVNTSTPGRPPVPSAITATGTSTGMGAGIGSSSNAGATGIAAAAPSGSSSASGALDAQTRLETGITAAASLEDRKRQMMEEKVNRLKNVALGGHDAAISVLQRSMGTKRPRDDIPQLRNRLRSTISVLNHSTQAQSHNNTNEKLDLTEQELTSFHRPRATRFMRGRHWNISVKREKPISFSVNAGAVRPQLENERQDLSAHTGEFICMEYVEECPPVIQNIGMASALLNYYRTPDNADGDDLKTRQRKETMKKLGTQEPTERVPRHLQLLTQQRSQKQFYEYDANIPRLPLGETKVLSSDDPSPFLGKISTGEIVPTISNNLFRAPLFAHKSNSSDFLMIRIKNANKADKSIQYVLREIPRIFVVGQLEPQKVVPHPSRMITKLQESMVLLSAARFLRLHVDPISFSEVSEAVLNYSRRKRCFESNGLKKLLKDRVAEEVNSDGARKWRVKIFNDEANRLESTRLMRKYSPEELEKQFTPEDVCLQESCNAAELKLQSQGIFDIDIPRMRLWLERMKRFKDYRVERAAFVKYLVDCSRSNNNPRGIPSSLNPRLRELLEILTNEIVRLEDRISAGQYIHDRLLSAPWNTTEAFDASKKDGLGSLELVGQGDPSGCGLGFAFVKILKERAAAKKEKEKLVSTDKDLRALTKPDLVRLLRGFNVSNAEMAGLRRWDMVHLVREHATKAESIGMSAALHKFARGATNPAGGGKQDASNDRSTAIWDRQKAALSNSHISQDDDEDEDDDFDLEDQLWAKKDVEEVIANRAAEIAETFHDKSESRRNQIQSAEEKDLQQMRGELFREGASSSSSTDLKPMSLLPQSVSTTSIDDAVPSENNSDKRVGLSSRPQRVVKRVIRTIRDDGKEVLEVQFLCSPLEVERVEREQDLAREKRNKALLGDDFESENEEGEDAEGGRQGRGLLTGELKLKISTVDHKAKQRAEEEVDYDAAEMYKPVKSTMRSSGIQVGRLGRIRLAAKLEKDLMSIWTRPTARNFHYPVSKALYPKYYDVILHPICLLEIRNKIVALKYSSIEAILADMDLLLRNAIAFNGINHTVSTEAKSISAAFRSIVTTDRTHLGVEKDEYSVLENEIKKKEKEGKKKFPNWSYRDFPVSQVTVPVSNVAPSTIPVTAAAPVAPIAPVVPFTQSDIPPNNQLMEDDTNYSDIDEDAFNIF